MLSQREHTTLSSGTLPDRMRYYSNTAEGMVQSRRDGRIENGVFVQGDPAHPENPKPNFQFVNASGQQLAQLREGGEVTLAATKQQAASTRTEDTMLAVAGTSPYAAGGGKVLVQEGDTLSSLAQRVYGNSGLWYVLAQANGLSDPDGPLTAGTALNAPSVSVNKNDAGTFRPYNPAEAIGPTSPELPFIDPPKQGCNVLATLIIVAITVAVAATVGPEAGKLFGSVLGEFVGGVAGSLAGQAAGMALGVTDHLSLRSAFASGLTAALTADIAGKLDGTTSQLVDKAMKAGGVGVGKVAASALLNAGASAVGSRVSGTAFSWKAVAANTVSNMVTAGISHAAGLDAQAITGGSGSFGDDLANGLIGGVVNVHTRRQFGFNDRIDYGNIAADAFGNALGNALGNAVAGAIKDQRLRKQQEFAAQLNDRALAISTEAQSRLDEAVQARNKDIDQYLQDRLAGGLQTRLDKRQDALQDKLSAGLSKQNDEAVAALVREAAMRKAESERTAVLQARAVVQMNGSGGSFGQGGPIILSPQQYAAKLASLGGESGSLPTVNARVVSRAGRSGMTSSEIGPQTVAALSVRGTSNLGNDLHELFGAVENSFVGRASRGGINAATDLVAEPFKLGYDLVRAGFSTLNHFATGAELENIDFVSSIGNAVEGGASYVDLSGNIAQEVFGAPFLIPFRATTALLNGDPEGFGSQVVNGAAFYVGAKASSISGRLPVGVRGADVNIVANNGGPVILDLFGGRTSQIPGAINVDIAATQGVRASAAQLPFRVGIADEVVASNPYIPNGNGMMDFLPQATEALKPGGQLIINSTARNPFGMLPETSVLDRLGLRIIQQNGPLPPRFESNIFRFTDGRIIPNTSVRTTILEKVNP